MADRRSGLGPPVLAGIFVLLAACSTKTVTLRPGAGGASPVSSPTTMPSSSSPTAPPSLDQAAAEFALALQTSTGQNVRYAVIEAADLKQKKEDAPDLVIEFPSAPKSFNGWQAMNDLLVGEGQASTLQASGFTSFGAGIEGSTIQFSVNLDDAAKVPGPHGKEVVQLVLLKSKPTFIDA